MMRRPFFQEFIISLVLTKKRIKALAINMDREMVMIVTRFKNRFLKMSSIARLKNSVIILFFDIGGGFKPSLLKVQDLPTGLAHQGFVMGRNNNRCTSDMNALEKIKNHLGGLIIQASGGFISKNYFWIADDGSGHGDPLLFAAGQTGWERFQSVLHAHQPQNTFDLFLNQTFFNSGSLKDQCYVVIDASGGDQLVILKDDTEFAS